MKIVIPMSAPDHQMAELFLSCLEKFGGLKSFDIILSPSEGVMRGAESLLPRFQALGRKATILKTGYQDLGRWPQGPNAQWSKTASALDASGNKDSWFWMEMDCLPVVEGWASRIVEEHAVGGKRFTGKIVPVPLKDGGYSNSDLMMMGCAVYCAGLTESWEFRPILDSMVVGVFTGAGFKHEDADPWDLMARGSFKKWGWHHTDLIGDRWNTTNYRIEGGQIVCDAGPTRFKNRAHNATDIAKAVVVHGCKDTSLHQLILSGDFQRVHSKLQEEVADKEAVHSAGYSKDPLELIMGREVTLDEKLKIRVFFDNLLKPSEKKGLVTLLTQQEQEQEMVRRLTSSNEETSGANVADLVPKIEAIVASGSIRFGKLAETLGITKEELQPLLEKNGYKIASVSQWVQKAA